MQLGLLDPLCRRLMTVPGVGVVALTYRTDVDAPERFSRSRDVGGHFGLTPRRCSTGQADHDGTDLRCSNAELSVAAPLKAEGTIKSANATHDPQDRTGLLKVPVSLDCAGGFN